MSGAPSMTMAPEKVEELVQATLPVQAAMGPAVTLAWQLIDTAPKDGTEIVGFNSHTKTVSRTWWCHASYRTQEWKMVPRGTAWRPTHWVPSPILASSLTADPGSETPGGQLEPITYSLLSQQDVKETT